MIAATPEPVVSGVSYAVLLVGGRPPAALDDFVGDTELTFDRQGRPCVVHGYGVARGDRVRFREKDESHGKDVRVWEVRPVGDRFEAEHLALF